jgi:hypothetical protein
LLDWPSFERHRNITGSSGGLVILAVIEVVDMVSRRWQGRVVWVATAIKVIIAVKIIVVSVAICKGRVIVVPLSRPVPLGSTMAAYALSGICIPMTRCLGRGSETLGAVHSLAWKTRET